MGAAALGSSAAFFTSFLHSQYFFMSYIPKVTCFAGAASATLQTAVTNFNTAAATAVTAALAAANYIDQTAKVAPAAPLWDGTNYTLVGSVTYYTSA